MTRPRLVCHGGLPAVRQPTAGRPSTEPGRTVTAGSGTHRLVPASSRHRAADGKEKRIRDIYWGDP